MFPTVLLIINISSVAVLWIGADRVSDGDMQVGSLIAYLSYLVQILFAVVMATFMVSMIPRAAVAAERIVEVLDTESSVRPPATPVSRRGRTRHPRVPRRRVPLPGRRAAGAVEASRSGSRPARPRRSSARPVRARPRSSTSSPACSMRPRAAVLVDGVDVRDLDPDLLWSKVGYVPQKPFLFSGTVATQPALRPSRRHATTSCGRRSRSPRRPTSCWPCPTGSTARSPRAAPTCRAASASGLSIARALVVKPEIYVFDDSFSALDLGTDARLRAALAPHTARRRGADRRPAGVDDRRRRPDPGARRRRDHRARHATTSCSPPARPTPRSSPPRSDRRSQHDQRRHSAERCQRRQRCARRWLEWRGAGRPRRRQGAEHHRTGASARQLRPGRRGRDAGREERATSARRCAGSAQLLGPERPRLGCRPGAHRRERWRSWSLGPRLLGQATDIIVEVCAATVAGSTSAALHRQLCGDRGRVPVLVGARLRAGLHPRRRRPALDVPAARVGRGQAQPPAAELHRQPAPRRPAQPGHQRHRQPGAEPAADHQPDPHLDPHADRRGRDDVRHLAAPGRWSRW